MKARIDESGFKSGACSLHGRQHNQAEGFSLRIGLHMNGNCCRWRQKARMLQRWAAVLPACNSTTDNRYLRQMNKQSWPQLGHCVCVVLCTGNCSANVIMRGVLREYNTINIWYTYVAAIMSEFGGVKLPIANCGRLRTNFRSMKHMFLCWHSYKKLETVYIEQWTCLEARRILHRAV